MFSSEATGSSFTPTWLAPKLKTFEIPFYVTTAVRLMIVTMVIYSPRAC